MGIFEAHLGFFFLIRRASFTSEQHTHPVEAGLSAELVSPRRAEVVVWPEGLVERCDEVEKSLPATLVAQRVFSVLTAFPQP